MRSFVSTVRPCIQSARVPAAKCVSRSMASASDAERAHLSAKQRALMAMEDKYGAHNYHPLPVRKQL